MKTTALVLLGILSYLIYVCDRVLCAVTFKKMHGFEEWGNSVFTQYGMRAEFMYIRASFLRVFWALIAITTFIILPYWVLGMLTALFGIYVIYLTIKSKKK